MFVSRPTRAVVNEGESIDACLGVQSTGCPRASFLADRRQTAKVERIRALARAYLRWLVCLGEYD